MQLRKNLLILLILLFSQLSCARQMSDISEFEKMLACQGHPVDKYVDASILVSQLNDEAIIQSLETMPRYQFKVIGDLTLFGLKPIYIGHAHGDLRGTFARFSEDIAIVVKNLKAKGIDLKKHNNTSITAYIGTKNNRYQLIVTTIPKNYSGKNNPSVPYSSKDTTLVQCVYSGS